MNSPGARFPAVPAWAMTFRRWALRSAAAQLRPQWIRSLAAADLSGIETFAPLRLSGLPDGTRLCVIAPHPDDESIGCGGLIARWTAAGRAAEVVFLTAGEAGDRALRRPGLAPAECASLMARTAATRRAEAEAALAILGAGGHWLDGTDGALHRDTGRIAARLRAQWQAQPPDLIAMPFPADRHADHAAAARIVIAAAAGLLPPATPVWGYEVWSPCPANVALDIAGVAGRKAAAIGAHRSQVATTDYAAAAMALGTYRAVTAGLGAGAAEAAHLAPLADMARIVAALRL